MDSKFLSFFNEIEDHRIDRKKLHPLINIIAIAIGAVICKAESWEDIHQFGLAKKEWFEKFLDLKNGIPCSDTFRRFFTVLDPSNFEECFVKWGNSIVKEIENETINIDGKSIRRANRMNENNPIHIVSAWASDNEIVLGQIRVKEKSNEITAIPDLLDALFVEGAVITIDAMGCQKEIAKKIVDQKADYILSLKENQPNLYDDVVRSFENNVKSELIETEDFGHGRIENRKYYISNNLDFVHDTDSWEELHSIIKVVSTRTDKKTLVTVSETRYFISSLNDHQRIAGSTRSHWGVENKLHWSLDVLFNEDNSAKRAGNSAHNFNIINKIAINIIKKDKENMRFKGSVNSKRLRAGWSEELFFHLMKLQ